MGLNLNATLRKVVSCQSVVSSLLHGQCLSRERSYLVQREYQFFIELPKLAGAKNGRILKDAIFCEDSFPGKGTVCLFVCCCRCIVCLFDVAEMQLPQKFPPHLSLT